MVSSFITRLHDHPRAVQFLILLSLTIALAANLYGLLIGVSVVIPHLLYIPIILAAFFYPRRGVAFAVGLSVLYFLMVALVSPITSPDIISAAARCVVYVTIAAIVSYLSERVSRKERALVRAKEEWENTFNGVPDLIAIIGKDHRILRVNRSMADSLGILPEQAVGMRCYEVVHTSKTPPANCPHEMLLKDGQEHTAEIHEENLGGDFLVTVSPLHDDDGNLTGSIHVARDITDRKQVEVELLLHSVILQNLAEGVALVRTRDGTLVFTNTRFNQLFGYQDGELAGQPVAVLNAPDTRSPEEVAREIEDDLEKYGIWTGEVRNRKKDGTSFFCHAIVSTFDHPVYGRVWITVHEDITERKQIQSALAGTEQRYRQLYEGMRDAFASTDLEGRITGFNQAFAKMTGYEPEEIYTLNFRDLTPEHWRDDEEEILKSQVMVRGYSDIYEKEYRHKDGTIIPVELRTALITGEDSTPQGMWAIIRDITDRKRAEEALRLKTEELDQYFSTSLDLFCIADTNGNFRRLNPEWEKSLGYSLADLEGKRFLDFVHPDDLPATLAALADLSSQKEVLNFTNRYRHRNGTYRWIEWKSFPKGNQIFAAARDITGRKQIEEALRESEGKYRTIIEEMQDMFYRTDPSGTITMLSPSAIRLAGYTSVKELIGQDVSTVYADPADREKLLTALQEKGSVYAFPLDLKTRDGRIMHVTTSSHFYRDAEGKILGVEGVIHDITDQRRAEEALKEALRKLNMLSSITRHDILNQITGLRTFLELSKEDLKGTKYETFIDKEDQAAEAIQRQIEFTRFYQDIGVNAPKWQDAEAVIKEAVAQLSLPAIDMQVTVTGVEIFADPLIVKVFFNLMENSLRHGERVTEMSFSSRASEAGLVITYRDNGVGISDQDKKKLFQKGFGKHTGLGLFLSREILAITSITITENGEPGKGVRFEMTIPAGAFRFIS